ncbi:ribosome-binding ATPase YchF [Clostridia bacterium]|nr:ribosome-binding ATPase YchF [Clostridia bacterium]
MKLGMVGLPNVGKSTLWGALTDAGTSFSANFPFCTIEPNRGVVSVPDPRLEVLRDAYQPDKYTPAVLEFMDIAGLVRGAGKGEGLGNKFLADIRESDAIIHVVRCFENSDIIHVDGSVDPLRDIETINLELIFSDLELLERRLDKARKAAKSGADSAAKKETAFLEALYAHLENGSTARSFDAEGFGGETCVSALKSLPLLSGKPTIYAANLSDGDLSAADENSVCERYRLVADFAKAEGSVAFPVSAQTEAELAGMASEEKLEFLRELGIGESGLSRIIREGYKLLGLISYFTAGKQEVRAWTIENGTKAPKAAGKIHTDFEKGFIRAEVTAYADLLDSTGAYRGQGYAKEKGLVRLEGKEYVMKDGDVVLFRFNV